MIAMNLSLLIFRLLSALDSITSILRFLRRISLQIVVFVDNEGCKDSESFLFCLNFNGHEFYSVLLESMDAANSGDVNFVRRIKRFLLQLRIAGVVAAGRNCILPWRELFFGAGMMPVPLSECTESQADWLMRRS
ncbi:Transcription factor GRAS [Macleaya cordata]|uniref:Transcription factor GRAS n=1 Tax=Macleaya cordata TaxID=56857 RepID=A0A200QK15_MACCD|nr:Transcription factor GRAS [Macleaya cordata]